MEQVNIILNNSGIIKKEVGIWARICYVCGQSGDAVNATESDGFLGKKRGELYFSIYIFIYIWLEICIKAKTRCIHLSVSPSMNIRG